MGKYLTNKTFIIAGMGLAVLLVAWFMIASNDSTKVSVSDAKDVTESPTDENAGKSEQSETTKEEDTESAGTDGESESSVVEQPSQNPSDIIVSLPENETVERVEVEYQDAVESVVEYEDTAEPVVEEVDDSNAVDPNSDTKDEPKDEDEKNVSNKLVVTDVTIE